MAGGNINIRIGTTADLKAMRDTSAAAAKMVADVARSNDEMRQSVLKSAAAYDSIAASADKAALAAGNTVLSAKQIEEKWREAMTSAKTHTEEVEKAVTGLGRAVQIVGGILSGMTGPVGFIVKNLFLGGIWKAAGRAVELFSSKVQKAREELEKAKEAKLSAELKAIADGEKDVVAAFDKGVAAIDKQVERTKKLLELQQKLVAAEMELQKQKELTAATGNPEAQAIIEQKFKMRAEESSANTQADSLLSEFNAAVKKMDEGEKFLRDMDRWFADADAKTAEYESKIAEIEAHARTAAIHRSVQNAQEYLTQSGEAKDYARYKKQLEEIRKARAAGESNVQTMKERMVGYSETMERTSGELAALNKLREARQIENERYVDEKSAAIDKAEAEEEKAAREAADKKAKEDAAAAQKAAAEREKAELAAQKQIAEQRLKDEQELHRQRMDNLKKEMDAQKASSSTLKSTAQAAKSEFDRAFAMYRDPSRARAEIGEEQSYRDDLDRLHKDARRYAGKWRIDELSSLMAAGDTQGVSDTLAQWRKSKSFTPDVEAMVRASAAEQTKTTVEDELRKIENNTADLSAKLDELLKVKG